MRLDRNEWAVEPVPLSAARRLVATHHYSGGGSNTGTFVHGLMRRDDSLTVRGVAWWIPPTKGAAIVTFPEGDWRRVLVLHRLVCDPDCPKNAASFLLGRSMRLVEQSGAWDCLVTYADTARGHTGAIYRATNWEYMGETQPSDTWLMPDGRQVSRKAGPRTRTGDDMRQLGARKVMSSKHKFRKLTTAPRESGTLFSVSGAAA
jgi:hypothetical protein